MYLTMTGTVLLTGANGSLAIPAVEYLLSTYPSFTLVLTVRDDSEQDRNTTALRQTVAKHSNASVSIRKLDLGSLKEAQSFCEVLHAEIKDGKLPRLAAIVCNAMIWKLSGGPAYSDDGFESTLAINHLAHFTIALRLLGAMDAQHGRIVFLGSQGHWPDKAGLSKGFPTRLPEDLEVLVHPPPDPKGEEMGRGFQRYGLSKLASLMVAYELNQRLKKVCCKPNSSFSYRGVLTTVQNKDTQSIRAVTIDPGDLLNSKTFFRAHVPMSVQIMIFIGSWLLPLLRLLQPRLSSVEQAAKPVIDIAVADEFAGQEGYFEGREKATSSPDSLDEDMQRKLWEKSVAWCGLKPEDTVIDL